MRQTIALGFSLATAATLSSHVLLAQPAPTSSPPVGASVSPTAVPSTIPVAASASVAPPAPPAPITQAPVIPSLAPPPPPPAGAVASPLPVVGKWATSIYGFVELDTIRDSTQSFNEPAGNGAIARPSAYEGGHDRVMFGVRNSRLGFKVAAPEVSEVKASAILETDFLGNQATGTSEAAVFGNPALRIRHFAIKIEDPYIDVLAGQYWQLFGWQSYFHPNTVEIQGLPGQVYSRAAQIRLSHTFKSDPVNVEVAVAASRPAQRDSGTPDGQAGIRLLVNDWKGLHTAGSTGTSVDALGIGVSGIARHFEVKELAAAPVNPIRKNGWGISLDLLAPVIPAKMDDRANALTLTGSFVTGAGIADLYSGLTGGASFPSPPNPAGTMPAPTYTANIDPGIVVFAPDTTLHPVAWRTFIIGGQYYLPPSGKMWVSGNYSESESNNLADFTPASGQSKIFTKSRWYDVNAFWDATPAVRIGIEYAWFSQTYGDGVEANNKRAQMSFFYLF